MSPALTKEQRYTYEDYCAWEGGDVRYELIDGFPCAMAGASADHQRVLGNLFFRFKSYLDGKTCEVFVPAFDVKLDADGYFDSVVQPDIAVVCDKSKIKQRGCDGAPDLIAEIISHSTAKRDRYDKFLLYQRAGVREYWIVDMESLTVQVHLLDGQRYFTHTYGNGDIIPVNVVLEGLEMRLADVFAGLAE